MVPRPVPATITALLLSVTFLLAGCSGEETRVIGTFLNVPAAYPTPQAAVDAAMPGEIVLLQPGIYTHMETRFPDDPEFPRGIRAGLFLKDGVWVEGAGSPGGAVLRDTTGADTTYGVAFLFTDNTATIRNLSIEGFNIGAVVRGKGGSILCSRFRTPTAGIWIFRAEAPRIVGNLVEGAAFDGILNQFADARIAANLVLDCGAGTGVEFPGSPVIQENIFCGNRMGLGANTDASPIVFHNVIVHNSAAGFLFAGGAVPVAVENDLYDNGVDIRVGFYPSPLDAPIDATSNFWNSLDLDAIAGERILDRSDDPASGATVAFLPISPSSWNPFPFPAEDVCDSAAAAPERLMLLLQEAAARRFLPNR